MRQNLGSIAQVRESVRILEPGRNCWCLEKATRVGLIIDAAAYFTAFAEACSAAQRQILILGWDFDRRERLHRGDENRESTDRLGAFLVNLVRRRPKLNIYLLSWDFNMIYAAERELLPALRLRLQAPPRFHVRLDDKHPNGASHHQKVVVVDDRIAFAGGIDLSRWRWDTPAHAPEDPRRIDADGKVYPPFHDMMMVVEGPTAAKLGDLARARWRRARGWRIRPAGGTDASVWPDSVEPVLHSQTVAIARTEPEYRGQPEVREVEHLYLDAIASARRSIYIENQYFTARSLGEALGERLSEADGPEVIIVLPRKTGGWLEQATMDVLRGRIIARMQQADQHDRLRVYYPHQPGLGDDCISVHAKLLIVDDRFLRVGSSNTSGRSMGLDTECDLAIEAEQEGDAASAVIRKLRHQLLAEHLACPIEQVSEAESGKDALIPAIESLKTRERSLRALKCRVPDDVDEMVPDAAVIDPSEPLSPDYFVAEYVPKRKRSIGERRLRTFLALTIVLLGLAAAWRWTPLEEWISPQGLSRLIASFPSPEIRAGMTITGVVIGSLLMVPLTVLAVVAGIVFQDWQAFVYVLSGAVISSGLGFLGGRLLTKGRIERIVGSEIDVLCKRLSERGTVAVTVLRLVPIAPFAIFNLAAGISHLGFRQFILGSLLGLAPGIAVITFFSSTLWQAIIAPSLINLAIAAAVGAALVFLAHVAGRWLRSG